MRPLSVEQESRVRRALRTCGGDVGLLQSPEELHAFVLNYDAYWSRASLLTVIRNPVCDRGTALWVYWNCQPVTYYERYAGLEDVRRADEREGYRLLKEIEARYGAGFYTNQNIRYDPAADWQCPFTGERVGEQLRMARLRQPIPPHMLEPSPGEYPPDPHRWFIPASDGTD